MRRPIKTVDAQVHVYERDHPGRPWRGSGHGPPEVTGETMVMIMDDQHIDAAVIVSPSSIYGWDAGYSLQTAASYPGRFGVVAPVDLSRTDLVRAVVEWTSTPYAVGFRLILSDDRIRAHALSGALGAFFEAVQDARLPLNIHAPSHLEAVEWIAMRYAGIPLAIDHLGIRTTFAPPLPPDPFKHVPALLALARFENIHVKATGIPAVSREPFPYSDIWDPLRRVIDSFGPDRVMWGTDWTRATAFYSYQECLQSFATSPALGADERSLLLGGTARRFYQLDEKIL